MNTTYDTLRAGRPPSRAERERGVVLIWTAITVMLVAGLIFSATDSIKAMDEVTESEFSADGLASRIAESGLVDAYAWLRRQPVQPVQSFSPKRDLSANPPINETDNPAVGLVRTVEISPDVWARYTVRQGSVQERWDDANGNGVYDVNENWTESIADGVWTPATGTRDVSTERGMPGNGAVWRLEAIGEVFKRPRADLPLGQGPNTRIAFKKMAQEVRRMSIAPPGDAAICCARGDQVRIAPRGRIRGNGGAAVVYAAGTGNPITGGGEWDGLLSGMPSYQGTVNKMFGVDLTEIKSMADMSVGTIDELPPKLPDYSLVVVEGNAVFDGKRPLRGTGVLIVLGDLILEDGNNSFFSGMIFCAGNVRVNAPAYLRGTIIAGSSVEFRGSGGDYAELEYDPGIVGELSARMGNYRVSKSPFEVAPMLADGRPSELHLAKRRLGKGMESILSHASGNGSVVTVPPVPVPPGYPKTPGDGDDDDGDDDDGTTTPPVEEPEPEPEPEPETRKGFSPDGLIDALQDYLQKHPDGKHVKDLEKAIKDLEYAKRELAKDPVDEAKALKKIKDGLYDVIKGMRDGVPLSSFSEKLDGGEGSLMQQVVDTMVQMREESTNKDKYLDKADRYNKYGNYYLERARRRAKSGNETGAVADYRKAVSYFERVAKYTDND